jgi:hypothetical protein
MGLFGAWETRERPNRKKPAVVVAQETVSNDTKGKTIVESRSLVVGDGFDVTPEDAYDFDDEH